MADIAMENLAVFDQDLDGKDTQAEYLDTRDASERSGKKRNAQAEYHDTRDAPERCEKKHNARQDDDREDI